MSASIWAKPPFRVFRVQPWFHPIPVREPKLHQIAPYPARPFHKTPANKGFAIRNCTFGAIVGRASREPRSAVSPTNRQPPSGPPLGFGHWALIIPWSLRHWALVITRSPGNQNCTKLHLFRHNAFTKPLQTKGFQSEIAPPGTGPLICRLPSPVSHLHSAQAPLSAFCFLHFCFSA